MTPQELNGVLKAGLLSYPQADFNSNLHCAPEPCAERLATRRCGAWALLAGGSTGSALWAGTTRAPRGRRADAPRAA